MARHDGSTMLTGRLEHEGEGVASILGLEGDDVVVAGALEDLGDRGKVEAERDGAVAAVVLESLATHQKRDERNVRGVHGLHTCASDRVPPPLPPPPKGGGPPLPVCPRENGGFRRVPQ